jgi:hypothetical protein
MTAPGDSRRPSGRSLVAAGSLICYASGLLLPGLAARGVNPYGFESYRGYLCLAYGVTTIFGNWTYFLPWTANVLYAAAFLAWLVTLRPPRWSVVIPLAGLCLAATVFRIDSVMVNEAGHRAAVHPGSGAWLWMASQAILLVGFLAVRPGRDNRAPQIRAA